MLRIFQIYWKKILIFLTASWLILILIERDLKLQKKLKVAEKNKIKNVIFNPIEEVMASQKEAKINQGNFEIFF